MKRSRYTVGEMANLCNVTAKQLRYYDQQGLLKPAYRDRQNGYRYYEDSQIEGGPSAEQPEGAGPAQPEDWRAAEKKRDLRTLSRELEEHLYEVRQARDATVAKYDALIDNILRIMGGCPFWSPARLPRSPASLWWNFRGLGGLYPLPVLLEGQPALHLPPGGAAEADGSGGAGTCGCEYGDLSLRLQEAVQ